MTDYIKREDEEELRAFVENILLDKREEMTSMINKRGDEYIKRKDAIKALEEDIPITDNPVEVIASAIAALEEQPSADVVEVVRCEYCKHLDKGENDSESWCECTAHFGKYFDVDESDYCSYGERKEE